METDKEKEIERVTIKVEGGLDKEESATMATGDAVTSDCKDILCFFLIFISKHCPKCFLEGCLDVFWTSTFKFLIY